MAPSTKYDVVLNYHGSGSATTTTGTISASTNSLAVASAATFAVGQGIYVAGAVSTSTPNPNGNLITSITAISGTTLTLAANATVSVTSAVVQHYDCAAINSALADAFNNGGGTVWLRHTGVDGVYRCNGLGDATTGGVLTLPQNLVYSGGPPPVALIGEDSTVSLDFSLAANVTGNSAFAAAPYVVATSGNYATVFEAVDVIVDNLSFGLPAQTKLNGLMLANAEQAHIGDHFVVAPAPDVSSPCCTWNLPTGGSTGIWMPQAYNNVKLSVAGKVAFMNHCLVPGEHGVMMSPYLYGCNAGLYLYSYNHDVEGSARIESSPIIVQVDASASGVVPVTIHIDAEGYGSSWMSPASNVVVDANSKLAGTIDYMYFAGTNAVGSGSNGMQFFTRSGALNVNLHNAQSIALYGASGFPLPTCIAQIANDKEVVYDATTPTYYGTYVSGGAVFAPVYCNGSNWVTY